MRGPAVTFSRAGAGEENASAASSRARCRARRGRPVEPSWLVDVADQIVCGPYRSGGCWLVNDAAQMLVACPPYYSPPMLEVDDHELLQRWQGGDAAAGEVLVERYFDPIYWFFHSKLDAEADELVQSTFLACLAAKDRFRGDSSFRAFLYGIARNQLFAALRGRSRAAQHIDLEVSSIADLVSTPRTKLARGQEYEQLVGQLRRLPVEQQTLLELHYWNDVGMSELAEIFGAPEVTIRSRLHRARNALRELLQAEPELAGGLDGEAPGAAGVSLDAIDGWARRLSPVRTE